MNTPLKIAGSQSISYARVEEPQDSPQAARCGISRAVAGKVAFPFMAHREGRAAQQDHAGAGHLKNIRREGQADAPETAGDEVASL